LEHRRDRGTVVDQKQRGRIAVTEVRPSRRRNREEDENREGTKIECNDSDDRE